MSGGITAGAFFFLLYPIFFFLCVEDLWGALRPAGCESGNKEIDCICLRVGLSRRKQARKEGIETCVWLRVRSELLDECEGVSPLPVCFVSAVFLFSTPRSPPHTGGMSHQTEERLFFWIGAISTRCFAEA